MAGCPSAVAATLSTTPAEAGAKGSPRYDGCPPPPLGLPGPTRLGFGAGLAGGAGAGSSCGPVSGPSGPGWQFGHAGGGSDDAVLTSPAPNVSADMPTPVAITNTNTTIVFFTAIPYP